MLKPQQTQRIYAMGARLGLVESGNKNDLLHELVYSIAQKIVYESLMNRNTEKSLQTLQTNLK